MSYECLYKQPFDVGTLSLLAMRSGTKLNKSFAKCRRIANAPTFKMVDLHKHIIHIEAFRAVASLEKERKEKTSFL